VPVVRIGREEERNGGAANVAYNVVTLGAKASLLTVVGEDEASHKLEKLVANTGIQTHFGRDAALKTTVKLRVIGRQQQLIRLDFENTPHTEILASQTATFAQLMPLHDAVLFSDYGKGGLAHITDMIAYARAAGKPILVHALPKRHRHHPQPRGVAAGHWRLERRRNLAAKSPKPAPSAQAASHCAHPQRRGHDAVR
jgi:rfaE bifunctional protein kinase chain/domain